MLCWIETYLWTALFWGFYALQTMCLLCVHYTMPGPDSENWMCQMFLVSLRRVYEAFYFSPCLYIQLSARWFLRSTSIMCTCTSTPLIRSPFLAAPFIIYWQLLGCSLARSISVPALVLKEFPVHCFQVGLKNIIPSAQILFRLAAFPLSGTRFWLCHHTRSRAATKDSAGT